jgi:hypothetical protein
VGDKIIFEREKADHGEVEDSDEKAKKREQ